MPATGGGGGAVYRNRTEEQMALDMMNSFLFVGGAGSRAYPAHQHAVSNEAVINMVRGRKHFVFWPPSEQRHLYPLGEGRGDRTEHRGSYGRGDQIYMGEGVFADFVRQPGLKQVAVGWEGIAERGDAAYVPCGMVHMVHNVDAVLAVQSQFFGHPRCNVWDEQAGRWAMPGGFLDEKLDASFQRKLLQKMNRDLREAASEREPEWDEESEDERDDRDVEL